MRTALQQTSERRRHLEDHGGTAPGHRAREAGKLDRVAETVLAIEKHALSREVLPAHSGPFSVLSRHCVSFRRHSYSRHPSAKELVSNNSSALLRR